VRKSNDFVTEPERFCADRKRTVFLARVRRYTGRMIFPLLLSVLAVATSPNVVVSQVYAGGGNTGAAYANDFVELFNRGSAAVDLAGWTVQYASASSSSWSATPLGGTIAPGDHYLVALASGGTVGAALPSADATGTTNLANTGRKVAVVTTATPLTTATDATVRDLVGYGTATEYEGSGAAPALTSTTALVRAGGGCTDAGDNASDFTTAAPLPRNVAGTAATCSGASATTATVGVDLDLASTLSLALDRTSVSFGTVVPGTTPPAQPVSVTVVSSNPAGYSLTVRRTVFTPSDLPLAISTGGAFTSIPTAADLQIGETTAATPATGDVRSTSLGFASPLAALTAGRYTATVTYTVIGR
jgi:hypothetical protein